MLLRKKRNRSDEPKLHKYAEKLTEIIIYFMVIFSPWAFGTTENWSIWIMNICSYFLGVLLITKWITRIISKYNLNQNQNNNELNPKHKCIGLFNNFLTITSAFFMFLLLGYIITSAINARASFDLTTKEFTYFESFNNNLPFSYNASGTWHLFWQYLGLIILFWATRDWLANAKKSPSSCFLNPRAKRFLFLISINCGILAFEGILQKMYYENTLGKLLFSVTPGINSSNTHQFGPFAYRSNAASYLNMIWPISLGLLIQLSKYKLDYKGFKFGRNSELILIPSIILIGSSPIISSSRAGSFIMIVILLMAILSLFFLKFHSSSIRYLNLFLITSSIAVAYLFGWEILEERIKTIFSSNLNNRTQIYEITLKMIDEYGFFGSGPGSFEALSLFEIKTTSWGTPASWHSWVHCDYLEFYLTFGKPGCAIIIAIIITIALQILTTLKFTSANGIISFFSIFSLLGLLAHALIDYPLQVYSVLQIATLILAFLINLSANQQTR